MAKDMKHQKRPHALVLPFPADGHITPHMRLSRILCSMGFAITFVNTQGNHARLLHATQQGFLDQTPFFKLVGLAGLPMEHTSKLAGMDGLSVMIECANSIKEPFEELVKEGISEENECPFTCIISDTVIDWPQSIATKYGLTKVSFYTSNAMNDFMFMLLEDLVSRGLAPIKDREASKSTMLSFISGLNLSQNEMPYIFHQESPCIDYICRGYATIKKADWVMVNTFEELEPKVIAEMRKKVKKYLPVGPLHPYAYTRQSNANGTGLTVEDESCLKWLDKQAEKSVLYVSFGSLSMMNEEQLKNIAKGVESSGKPFLWVQRRTLTENGEDTNWVFDECCDDDNDNDNDDGILTSTRTRRLCDDDDDNDDRILTSTRSRSLCGGNGLVVEWAPQMKVLLHPAIAGFFTHCGWNSALESISAGVPMLGWPLLGDQNLNLKYMVEEWKIALDFRDAERDERGLVCDQDVKRAVLQLLQGEEGMACRNSIQNLRDVELLAVGPAGSSTANLQQFVDAMKGCICGRHSTLQ